MKAAIPREFVWRRLQSLMGLWLVLFLMEHLIVNSQASLWIGDSGKGFIDGVNSIHNLPYLEMIELFLLGVPLLIHAVWGVTYALSAKSNSTTSDGSKPSIKTNRNRAYTWQRISSWILLIGLICHITEFRFLDYPIRAKTVDRTSYCVTIRMDNGLYTLGKRLGVTFYDAKAIGHEKSLLQQFDGQGDLTLAAKSLKNTSDSVYNSNTEFLLETAQVIAFKKKWLAALEERAPGIGQVVAVCPDFGTASLLSVRDHFKDSYNLVLYTVFVLAAVFHAFNGFWTFLITWGFMLKYSAQKLMAKVSLGLMLLIGFFGLAAIWGSYLINLRA